jgi:N-formylglutamate deformylase
MLEGPFEVVEPPEGDSPVVVEVPHAGLCLDAESAAFTVATASSIARDADLYVDELFRGAPAAGATLLRARLSRYIVDLNRAPADYDGNAVVGGPDQEKPRGVVWRLSSEGLPVLRGPLPAAELERRMERFYRPYHAALWRLLEQKRQTHGFAVMLCAHSMPTPRSRGSRPARLADIVPGTRGRSSASAEWIDLIDAEARAAGFTVEHDMPYRGGHTTGHYGRPAEGLHVVQVEIARRLYMDERTLARSPEGFDKVRAWADRLVAQLVAVARASASAGRPTPGVAPRRRAGVS